MNLREALLQAAQHLGVPVDGEFRMQAADDVKLSHRVGIAFAGPILYKVWQSYAAERERVGVDDWGATPVDSAAPVGAAALVSVSSDSDALRSVQDGD